MPHFRALRACLPLVSLAAVAWAPGARAAIPAGYTGTPYMGTPQAIPGRVELANLDEGGLNVAYYADHRRSNAVAEGYSPISGDDYRPGNLDLPNICKTNRAVEKPGEGSEDFWEDGTRYPSDTDLYWYYMGYAHTVDWVRVTVNVQQAGTYNVSSNWACDSSPQCGLSLWFNDGSGKMDNPDRPLDGENKSGIVKLDSTGNYHKWRKYPNFTQVTLSAGEQVMTFHVEVNNHLQYGFLQFDLVGGDPQGGGGAGGGGGMASGGSGGAAGGSVAVAGTDAVGGGVMTAGTAAGGTSGVDMGTAGSATAQGGTGVAMGGTGSATAGPGTTSPGNGSSNVESSSGCALSPRSDAGRQSVSWGLLLLGSLLLRRRRVCA